ncbi:MAG TPA: hypothetical protein VH639_13810 [Bryobacteraceae bacterium]
MRHRLFVAAVNIFIVVTLFGALEFTARVVQKKRLGPNALIPPARMDRWTGWRNTPNYQRYDIQHDAQGFRRDADVALEKPPNTVRIFLMGGSAAYGFEGLFRDLDPDWQPLYNRELIDAYLQKKLNKRHPERHWEVINAAVNEFRMHQHLVLLYAQLLQFHPDLVIFMDGHNDMSGLMTETAHYNPFAATPHEREFTSMVYPRSFRSLLYINSAWLRNNSVLFDLIYRRTLGRLQDQGIGPGADPSEPVHSPVQWADLSQKDRESAARSLANVGYYTQMAERLESALAHEGVPAIFSMQPELIPSRKRLTPVEEKFAGYTRQISRRRITYLWENLRPRIVSDMAASAKRNRYTFVDLEDAFDDMSEKAFTDYCHLTPAANERIAEKLYQAMDPALIARLIKNDRSLAVAAR